MSLPPTRETDRTSIRLPDAADRTRTTTSSLKPNHGVVAVASTRPVAESVATIAHPILRAASTERCQAAAGGTGSSSAVMSGYPLRCAAATSGPPYVAGFDALGRN